MKSFKTPKGTELPLLNLKGKDYLQVQHRLVWFREERPDWGIQTEFLRLDDEMSIARATIRDQGGFIMAQATKSESPRNFGDYIEKSESGAIGRALALCGFGTQFTFDLEEGHRIVDAPSSGREDPGSYIVQFGKKFRDMRLDACNILELGEFSKWIGEQSEMSLIGKETKIRIDAYLKSKDIF